MKPSINTILKGEPKDSRYGAPMGQADFIEEGYTDLSTMKVCVQMVRLVDHDYSPDGVYWGGLPSEPLYCGFNDEDERYARSHGFRIWVRAKNNDEAREKVMAKLIRRVR